MTFLRPRHLNRYRKIAEVMVRHGFGAVVGELGLAGALNLPRRLLRRETMPETRRTAAHHLREALEELGPTFVKLGQIASTRPEILPPAFTDELSKLQDDVPPAPWEEIKPLLEEELGQPIEEVFLALDPEPIASASLAQVYAAILADQTQVVVKVQRPNIERTIATDLAIIQDLARLAAERLSWTAAYDPVGLADEFAIALKSELDYGREGRNADRFRQNFDGLPFLYVPKVYWRYSSRRVLIMERITGIKPDNIERLDAEGYDRQAIAMAASRLVIQEILEDGYFHADPHPGNIVILPGNVIGLIDFGTVGYLDDSDRANLIRLYIAVIQFDVEAIVTQLIRMRIAGPDVDEDGLKRDLRRLLRKYYGMPLKDIAVNELLAEIQPIIYEYQLKIPSDYWLLLKTLVILEGVGKRLAPEFDVFAVSAPYVRRFLLRLASPTYWGPDLLRGAGGWLDLLTTFPRRTSRIMDRIERGAVSFDVDIPNIDRASRQLDRAANRIILAILIGTLTVALALLIPSLDLAWPWNLSTWLIVVGFVTMISLALWLIWSILRSNRR
jgi:ubiquinone biosynthesis protein